MFLATLKSSPLGRRKEQERCRENKRIQGAKQIAEAAKPLPSALRPRGIYTKKVA